VHGRRRIGKSVLLQHSLQGKSPLVFEALEERPTRDQLNHFALQLQHQTGHPTGTPRRCTEALLSFQPKKIRAGQGTNILAGLSGSGTLHAWMGRSFEYLCLQHARESAASCVSPSKPVLPKRRALENKV
jgi:hypothetical protein